MENSIGDRIEEKYTRYLNCEIDTLELTIEEAIFILETDESLHYVEDLLQEAYKVILSEYKRVLKENKELQEDRNKFKKALGKRITYCNELEKDLFENGSNYVIPKQKVKDKIEELNEEEQELENSISDEEREEYSDANISFELMDNEIRRRVLQELLEGELNK